MIVKVVIPIEDVKDIPALITNNNNFAVVSVVLDSVEVVLSVDFYRSGDVTATQILEFCTYLEGVMTW